jgi:23S rRNA pseudouridine1911/1915/1917 synthase
VVVNDHDKGQGQMDKSVFKADVAAATRLDKFLTDSCEERSRSYLQERIRLGNVMINGKIVTRPRTLVAIDDVVVVAFPPTPIIAVEPQSVDFTVVDEQEDFIVISKPAGLVVHPPSHKFEGPTLVAGILHRYPELRDIDGHERPGIIHRLDQDTSGLMVIARNNHAMAELAKLFHDRAITKKYLAIVQGHPPRSVRIDSAIGRHRSLRNSMTTSRPLNPRFALSVAKTITYYQDHALVSVDIKTGRTHQIRVHMASIGHKILGDNLYGVAHTRIKRQALHASFLQFSYKGTAYTYQDEMPTDMKRLLGSLGEPLSAVSGSSCDISLINKESSLS